MNLGWFRPHLDRSTLTLRVLNYERRPGDPPPSAGQMRMGAHTYHRAWGIRLEPGPHGVQFAMDPRAAIVTAASAMGLTR